MHAAAIGFGLGFFVALQLGPMSLFLIRSTLRSGWRVGIAIGCGIAVIDGLYAAAGAGGATPLLHIQPLRLGLGFLGAAVLIWLGARTLYSALRIRVGGEVPSDTSSPASSANARAALSTTDEMFSHTRDTISSAHARYTPSLLSK